jgi:suppressor of G2 allele of SKP1
MSDGQRGIDAVRARNFDEGIKFLDKALASSNSPLWLLSRAKAHQMLQNYELALQDAESAYHSAIARGSGNVRKLMIDAQYRRACLLLQLKRHADAICCAKWAMLLAEGKPANEKDGIDENVDEDGCLKLTAAEAKADTAGQPSKSGNKGQDKMSAALSMGSGTQGYSSEWNLAYAFRSQAAATMEKLPAGDAGRKVSVTKIPPKTGQRKTPVAEPVQKQATGTSNISSTKQVGAPVVEVKPVLEKGSVPDEKLKLRADFYQSNTAINVSLFAKNVDKEKLTVKFTSTKVGQPQRCNPQWGMLIC